MVSTLRNPSCCITAFVFFIVCCDLKVTAQDIIGGWKDVTEHPSPMPTLKAKTSMTTTRPTAKWSFNLTPASPHELSTASPSGTPAISPTDTPSFVYSDSPSLPTVVVRFTSLPTAIQSQVPTTAATETPTFGPTSPPTVEPTMEPTMEPTSYPSLTPTLTQSEEPSTSPTTVHSEIPTSIGPSSSIIEVTPIPSSLSLDISKNSSDSITSTLNSVEKKVPIPDISIQMELEEAHAKDLTEIDFENEYSIFLNNIMRVNANFESFQRTVLQVSRMISSRQLLLGRSLRSNKNLAQVNTLISGIAIFDTEMPPTEEDISQVLETYFSFRGNKVLEEQLMVSNKTSFHSVQSVKVFIGNEEKIEPANTGDSGDDSKSSTGNDVNSTTDYSVWVIAGLALGIVLLLLAIGLICCLQRKKVPQNGKSPGKVESGSGGAKSMHNENPIQNNFDSQSEMSLEDSIFTSL